MVRSQPRLAQLLFALLRWAGGADPPLLRPASRRRRRLSPHCRKDIAIQVFEACLIFLVLDSLGLFPLPNWVRSGNTLRRRPWGSQGVA